MYKESLEEANKGPPTPLQRRLKYQIAEKLNDEATLEDLHSKLLAGSIEDKLCVAAMHGLKNQKEDATNMYKKILVDNRYSIIIIFIENSLLILI
jgi:intraflagellar transport protein 56